MQNNRQLAFLARVLWLDREYRGVTSFEDVKSHLKEIVIRMKEEGLLSKTTYDQDLRLALHWSAVEYLREYRVKSVYPGSEILCDGCAHVFCPHGEPLHFHHDGCPAGCHQE